MVRVSVAVLIPCLNEAESIARVVSEFRDHLPDSEVWVYDNGSTDKTIEEALRAGAQVYQEPRKGKGHVVRRMFADVDADVFVIVDGDGTYQASAAPEMVRLLVEGRLDMVTGVRRVDESAELEAFRRGHRLGNAVFSKAVRTIFRSDCTDVLSGYRVLSRRFVKSFPSVAGGFEVEVEMTAHASLLRVPVGEVVTVYRNRSSNSQSKLNTYTDGWKIALAMFRLFRSFSPSRFFGTLSGIAALTSLFFLWTSLGVSPDSPRLDVGLILLLFGALLLSVGVILNAISRARVESLRLVYLSYGLTIAHSSN